MSLILDFVPFGENISGIEVLSSVVLKFLKKLETQLLSENHKWQDVSLLIMANSKALPFLRWLLGTSVQPQVASTGT